MNKANKVKHPDGMQWQGNQFQYTLRQLLYPKPFRIGLVPLPSLVLDEEAKPSAGEVPDTSPAAMNAEQALSPDKKKLNVQLATNLWRNNNKLQGVDESDKTLRSIRRHTESALDTLTGGKVEIKDHTDEKYVSGMALTVLTFQNDPHIKTETITETIKPSVYYNDNLIQNGEVVVSVPSTQNTNP